MLTWMLRVSSLTARIGMLAGFAGQMLMAQVPVRPLDANAPAAVQQGSAPSRFVVVLDAAHGGDDGGGQLAAGSQGGGAQEKTLTLAMSVRLRSLLTARGIQVVTTREANIPVETDMRVQIANHAGASACLSLHAAETGSGVHIFVSSLPATEQTRFLAWKTAQSAFVTRSLKLASTVNSALEHSAWPVVAADAGPIPVTLARTALPGVDSMACPALAIEIAPIRGADRVVTTEVTDPEYQAVIAETLAAALLAWRTELQGDGSAGGHQP